MSKNRHSAPNFEWFVPNYKQTLSKSMKLKAYLKEKNFPNSLMLFSIKMFCLSSFDFRIHVIL